MSTYSQICCWQYTIRLMQSRQHHIYVFREKYATNDSEPYGPVIAHTVANTNAIRKITRAIFKQATDEVFPTNPFQTQTPFPLPTLSTQLPPPPPFVISRNYLGGWSRIAAACGIWLYCWHSKIHWHLVDKLSTISHVLHLAIFLATKLKHVRCVRRCFRSS